MEKPVYMQESTDEFCGCLIAISCGEEGYLQGEVLGVDPIQRTITLRRPFKDGYPMDVESYLVLPTSIYELKILKMPPKKNLITSNLTHKKIQSKPASMNTPSKNKRLDQLSCSFDNQNMSNREILSSEKITESSSMHGKRINVRDLLKPISPSPVSSFSFSADVLNNKPVYTQESTNEFCGCLISIDCGEAGYLQGEVIGVDPLQRTITLGRPLKNGYPMEVESYLVLPSSIFELKILKMPPKKNLIAPTISQKKIKRSVQNRPSTGSEKCINSLASKTIPTKNIQLSQPSCSFDNQNMKVNRNNTKKSKITPENQLASSSVTGRRIDVRDLLKPSLQRKNLRDGQYKAQGNSYTKFGEYKLFNNQQVAAPRVLKVNKSRSAQEPSGMPLIDCNNGYSGYQGNAVELGDPIDFNELRNDFDFGANLALFNKAGLEESSPEDAKDGKTLIVTKNFRNDQNVLSDPDRINSWTKAASTNEYVGCLITISCRDLGCYQGKVVKVDSEKQEITIEQPLKDGVPLTENTLTVLRSEMQDLKVHNG